jgi:hypothetical protein
MPMQAPSGRQTTRFKVNSTGARGCAGAIIVAALGAEELVSRKGAS